jgi:predicted lipid-binding transport protein (Tim44 family)
MTTPEMLSYFSQDLTENAKKGVRNEVSGAKLLQGDLAEAWHEAGSDYATVAMRYSLSDRQWHLERPHHSPRGDGGLDIPP